MHAAFKTICYFLPFTRLVLIFCYIYLPTNHFSNSFPHLLSFMKIVQDVCLPNVTVPGIIKGILESMFLSQISCFGRHFLLTRTFISIIIFFSYSLDHFNFNLTSKLSLPSLSSHPVTFPSSLFYLTALPSSPLPTRPLSPSLPQLSHALSLRHFYLPVLYLTPYPCSILPLSFLLAHHIFII